MHTHTADDWAAATREHDLPDDPESRLGRTTPWLRLTAWIASHARGAMSTVTGCVLVGHLMQVMSTAFPLVKRIRSRCVDATAVHLTPRRGRCQVPSFRVPPDLPPAVRAQGTNLRAGLPGELFPE